MTQLANDFSFFEHTVEEYRSGVVLSNAQREVLNNRISEAALEILNTETDPLNPIKAEFRRAYLRGQIDLGRQIIAESNMIEREIITEQQQQQKLEAQKAAHARAYEIFKTQAVPQTAETKGE